jgi:hypothetical protein
MKTNLVTLATTATVAALLIVPSMSFGADRHEINQRNQWNSLAIGAGTLGVIGLASHNDTLAAIGLVGAGYSAIRASEVPVCAPYNPAYYGGDYRFRGNDVRRDGRDNRDWRR